jgi:hypothetical protein
MSLVRIHPTLRWRAIIRRRSQPKARILHPQSKGTPSVSVDRSRIDATSLGMTPPAIRRWFRSD